MGPSSKAAREYLAIHSQGKLNMLDFDVLGNEPPNHPYRPYGWSGEDQFAHVRDYYESLLKPRFWSSLFQVVQAAHRVQNQSGILNKCPTTPNNS